MRDDAERPAKLQLRLYVVTGAPNSIAARSNLAAILSPLAAEDYALEIVDCLAEPQRTLAEGVLVTPTLVKSGPEPRATIVGSLSDRTSVVAALGLQARAGGTDDQ
ncbi:MAG: circadian clock KaiB family protein [Gemmatimonadota bacterium]